MISSLFTLFSCSTAEAQKYSNVGVSEFEKLISKSDVQILDTRTTTEYEEGHIAGALLLNVNSPSFKEDALKTLDPEKTVAVYCRSGRRSRLAADVLSKEGYKVVNLDGGIISWNQEDKPIVK